MYTQNLAEPQSSMIIREARPTEAPALTEIAFAAKRYWGYSDAAMAQWTRTLTVSARSIARNPTWVAADATDRSLGFCMVWTDGRAWELEHLWVAPASIRRGIGKALLSTALQFARARGADSLRIDADPNAEGFYLACGARRIGMVAGPIPEDSNRMRPILVIDLGSPNQDAGTNPGLPSSTT